MSLSGGLLRKVAAVLAVGLVVSAAGVGAAVSTGVVSLQPPAVESVENRWGEVSRERTGIRTEVVVNNPNEVAVPGVASLAYDVSMNDVTVAEGSRSLALSPGRNELSLRTDIDNGEIPAWWASHVNNGEKTTLSVEPTVKAAFLSTDLSARERTFETDMLSSFDSDAARSVTVGNRTLLTVEGTNASWGRATERRTPLRFGATVSNPNAAPLRFSTLGYEVSMNDVTVAEGTTNGSVEIGANATETIGIDAALDNGKLDEWWVSHLRNGEQTDLDVSVFARMETDEGTRRIPLSFLSKRVAFETAILSGGETTTRTVETETETGFGFGLPRVESVERDWSEVESGGTRFSTSVVVNNPRPADSPLGEVPLDVRYRVALNGVALVEDRGETTLGPGRNEFGFSKRVSDRAIRAWWLSHVENGERTTLDTEVRALADFGFLELPVPVPEDDRTFETDMLGGFSAGEEEVTVRGRSVATLREMDAEWGTPTLARTPMVVSGEMTNERSRPLTVVKLGYEVRANDAVLADDETGVGTTIPGGETRDITATGHLDNAQIPAWWVGHLRNDERTELAVSYHAVVEYRGERFTVELDSMSYTDTVETDAFGSE